MIFFLFFLHFSSTHFLLFFLSNFRFKTKSISQDLTDQLQHRTFFSVILRLGPSRYNVALSGYLFVCLFVCVKAGGREVLGVLVSRLIMRGEKQTAERKSTHAHSRGLSGTPWCSLNFDMERKTGGSLLSTHTRINTYKHTRTCTRAGHLCPLFSTCSSFRSGP